MSKRISNAEPRKFFEQYVRPSYDDWMNNPLDIRLAKNAVSEANNMAERMFSRSGFGNPRSYRDHLSGQCEEFSFVWDIADAHKHVELGRGPRKITRDSQTNKIYQGYWPKGWFPKGWFPKGWWFEKEELVVVLDSGKRMPLLRILPKVIEMWEELLSEMDPLPESVSEL